MDGPRSQRATAWELSEQLRLEVVKITKQTTFNADTKLREQIADAADGVSRNLTEAFATDRDREFARFVRLACGSLRDLQDGLRAALLKKAFVERDVRGIRELLSRLYPALTSLLWRQPDTPRTDQRRLLTPTSVSPFAPTSVSSIAPTAKAD